MPITTSSSMVAAASPIGMAAARPRRWAEALRQAARGATPISTKSSANNQGIISM
ncbi:MAG: hypothetical protein HC915_07000 [Anaerolineae bacterium]|nr:hypothetical protein [Anaerolineae bacterium]